MGGKNSFFRKPFGTGAGSVAQATGMESPDVEKAELSGADKVREKTFIDSIEGDIAGENESLAVAQYKQAQEDALRGSMALASSTKGVSNPALLSRNIANVQDNQGQELAQQSGQMRMQERQNALNSMNSYLAAKQGVALNNAQTQNQASASQTQATSNFLSSLGQAAAAAASGGSSGGASAASDEKLKKNIKPSSGVASEKVEEFLNALDSYNFEYKDEKHGQGEKTGIMAQDLEKSELGKQMVRDTPEGKMVDFGQGFAAILAAQAELKDQLDSLKKKKA